MSRRLRFGDDEPKADRPHVNRKKKKSRRNPEPKQPDSTVSEKPSEVDAGSVHADDGNNSNNANNAEKSSSNSKLKFSKQERKIDKLEQKSDKYAKKLEAAQEKLPTKKVRKKERVFDEETGKAKNKLHFEEEVIPINEAKWNVQKKKSLPRKAAGAVGTAGINKLHSKVYEVEHENVGTQAAHRAELVGESAWRGGKKLTHSSYRFIKNSPYREASKAEVKAIKNDVKLSYQKALRDNPDLQSSPISRLAQKRRIKKEHAAALRSARKAGQTKKKAVGIVHKTRQFVTNIIRRNPATLAKIGVLALLVFSLLALLSMCGTLFSGGTAFIGATSYAAEDRDIDMAELSYTEWETDLQLEIRNAESTHSGYDEYRYQVSDIGHDPYELMGFLTSVYEDFSYTEAEAVLRDIFDAQYQLEFVPEVEIRTRTETRSDSYTDPETGETYTDTYEVEVEYEWHILNINLSSRSFYDVIYPRMNADQLQHFEILIQSKGNRQYVGNPFDFNWLPYVSSYYGYRVHPISGEKNYHKGIDIAVASGTEIKAGFDGVVTMAGYDAGGYGNYVVIEMRKENGDVIEAKYAHCHTLLVANGQEVSEGDVIAKVGSTGNSTGPHLHLEVVKNGEYLNPIYFAITSDDGSSRIPPGTPGGVEIPPYSGEPMGDGSYAALLAEAQRYIGYPYVFGGSSPSTSFDCSGYLCWIINQSGAGSVGRTTAQGLYNLCTPVSMENAKPGDLLFFHSTYSTASTVTHCALYIGNGQFLHAGDPIGYGNLNSNYWQKHFYAVGRLP